ncbi:DUF2190 domain-containing protein [Paracoccus nototheniae]|uniref:DUF2190 family protein n=1 Tax=Paracoccus nototheniae TaxID=2489002 RepID=A0ABW4DY27_9RHOB|nr:DUF2190 family protein [Paracoccus nototheniae]
MARNFIQAGDNLTIPAPASVLSGGVVIAGDIRGIALIDAAAGAPVDVSVVGCWELPKVAANAFTLGAKVYWNATDSLATTTASGNTLLGYTIEAAPADTAAVKVRLLTA